MTIKFVSLETKKLESGQLARVVTFDVDGDEVTRKIAFDTPPDKVDARIQDLADGLSLEYAKTTEQMEADEVQLTTSFKEGHVLFQ